VGPLVVCSYRRLVEPRPCVVVEGDDRWPGTVLA